MQVSAMQKLIGCAKLTLDFLQFVTDLLHIQSVLMSCKHTISTVVRDPSCEYNKIPRQLGRLRLDR